MTTVADPPRTEEARTVEVAYDVIDGVCVERSMGGQSSWVGLQFGTELNLYRRRAGGHALGADGSYRIFPEPHTLKFPDASYIGPGRVPGERPPEEPMTIAPDAVVEVVSPGDGADEVEMKVQAWLDAGTRLVWLAFPQTRHVYAYRQGGVRLFGAEDVLEDAEVLPGFSAPVASFFPPETDVPAEAAPSAG
jgi:Uma2 family endonuclease